MFHFIIWCFLTHKIDAHFDENKVLTFHGTRIAYFMLHILSSVKMLKIACAITYLTLNGDIVQYYYMVNFINIHNT